MMSDGDAVPNVETGLVYAHGLAALATLFISVVFAFRLSCAFHGSLIRDGHSPEWLTRMSALREAAA